MGQLGKDIATYITALSDEDKYSLSGVWGAVGNAIEDFYGDPSEETIDKIVRPLRGLCFYYGNPSQINDSQGDEDLAYEMFLQYDDIFFDRKTDPTEIAKMTSIIEKYLEKKPVGKVWGRIDISSITPAYSIEEIGHRISEWVAIGVTGILFDNAGWDQRVDRNRQNACYSLAISEELERSWVATRSDDIFYPYIEETHSTLGTGLVSVPLDSFYVLSSSSLRVYVNGIEYLEGTALGEYEEIDTETIRINTALSNPSVVVQNRAGNDTVVCNPSLSSASATSNDYFVYLPFINDGNYVATEYGWENKYDLSRKSDRVFALREEIGFKIYSVTLIDYPDHMIANSDYHDWGVMYNEPVVNDYLRPCYMWAAMYSFEGWGHCTSDFCDDHKTFPFSLPPINFDLSLGGDVIHQDGPIEWGTSRLHAIHRRTFNGGMIYILYDDAYMELPLRYSFMGIPAPVEDSPTYDEILETGWSAENGQGTLGTTIPDMPILEGFAEHRSAHLFWSAQPYLTNFNYFDLQVSDDQIDWYGLRNDGVDWKGTLDGYTQIRELSFIHDKIPLPIVGTDPVSLTLYYRVRRVTYEPVEGSWSGGVSVTMSPTSSGDLAASSVVSTKIEFNQVMAEHVDVLAFLRHSDEYLDAYWSLDDSSASQVLDNSGEGHHGSYSGANFTKGLVGQCLEFSVTDYAAFDNWYVGAQTDLTVSMWVRLKSFGIAATSSRTFISDWNNNSPGSQQGFLLYCQFDDEYPRFVICDGTDFHEIYSDSDLLSLGVWHHLVGVFKGSDRFELWIDGNLVNFTTPTASSWVPEITTPIYMGFGNLYTGQLDGYIDEVRIYNEALSVAEIKNLYLSPGGSAVGMVAAERIVAGSIDAEKIVANSIYSYNLNVLAKNNINNFSVSAYDPNVSIPLEGWSATGITDSDMTTQDVDGVSCAVAYWVVDGVGTSEVVSDRFFVSSQETYQVKMSVKSSDIGTFTLYLQAYDEADVLVAVDRYTVGVGGGRTYEDTATSGIIWEDAGPASWLDLKGYFCGADVLVSSLPVTSNVDYVIQLPRDVVRVEIGFRFLGSGDVAYVYSPSVLTLGTGQIIAENIVAGSITADRLNIGIISDISSDLGTMDAGSLAAGANNFWDLGTGEFKVGTSDGTKYFWFDPVTGNIYFRSVDIELTSADLTTFYDSTQEERLRHVGLRLQWDKWNIDTWEAKAHLILNQEMDTMEFEVDGTLQFIAGAYDVREETEISCVGVSNLEGTHWTLNNPITSYYVWYSMPIQEIVEIECLSNDYTTPTVYHECGLTGKLDTTDTGLTDDTKYYFKVDIDGSGEVEYDIIPYIWTLRTSSFSTSGIRGVAYNGSNLWVAVGYTGKIATSSDGITWAQETSSFSTTAIYGVAYNGSDLWVAVGGAGKIATSPDGETWTQRTSTFGAVTIYNVAHNQDDLWVAVGDSGALETSSNGTTWTSRTSTFGTSHVLGVAYNGSDLWVAVGQDGKLATSPDGETWTQRTSTFGIYSVIGVAHNQDDLWVAVGQAGKIATSSNGTSWTSQTSPFGTSNVNAVAYNGTDLWVAVAADGKLATSPDGEIWTLKASSFDSTTIYCVAHNYSDLWVVGGNSGTLTTSSVANYIIYSDIADLINDELSGVTCSIVSGDFRFTRDLAGTQYDVLLDEGINGTDLFTSLTGFTDFDSPYSPGIASYHECGLTGKTLASDTGLADLTQYYFKVDIDGGGDTEYDVTPAIWVQRTTPDSDVFTAVAYNGSDMFVAVGENGTLATSPDGETWTSRTSSFGSTNIMDVAYNGSDLWVAVGYSGLLATSPDGETWTSRTSSFGTSDIYSVTYGDDIWVAVGTGGLIATSSNGTSWTQETSPTTAQLRGVAYNGSDLWVAVGLVNITIKSSNGTDWSIINIGQTSSTMDIEYADGLWIVVGYSGEWITSPDGTTWTVETTFLSEDFWGVAHDGDGLWTMVGISGELYTSPDGETWTSRTSSFGTSDIYSVTYGDDIWVAVGGAGKIATSIGASFVSYGDLIPFIDTELSGVYLSVVGGDLRFIRSLKGSLYDVSLDSGTTGTDLFDSLTDFSDFDSPYLGYRGFDFPLEGKLFNISKPDGVGGETFYYVWFNVENISTPPTTPTGTEIEVVLSGFEDDDVVATAIDAAIDAISGFSTSVVTNTVEVTNDIGGVVTDAADVDTGFFIHATQQGGKTITPYPYGISEVTNLIFTDDTGNSNVNYGGFYINLYEGTLSHRFWWNVDGGSTPPSGIDSILHEIAILDSDDEDAIASKSSVVIDALDEFSSDYTTGGTFNVTHLKGPISDSSNTATPLTHSVTTQGAAGAILPIEVILLGGESDTEIATKSASAIDSISGFGAETSDEVIIVENDIGGVVTDAADVDSGVVVTVIHQGGPLDPAIVGAMRMQDWTFFWKYDVGIGTENPSRKLEIQEDYLGNSILVRKTNESTSDLPGVGVAEEAMVNDRLGTMSMVVPDPWVEFDFQTSPFGTDAFYGLSFNGTDLLVAVSEAGKIATSSDGITWTSRTNPDSPADLIGVDVNGTTWCAAGDGVIVSSSNNGVTWVSETPVHGSDNVNGVAYGDGVWVACGVAAKVSRSVTDTSSWAIVSGHSFTGVLWSIEYADDQFVIVGDSGQIATSSDGSTWTTRTSGTSNSIRRVKYLNGQFVAVGISGTIVTSPDGETWTLRTSPQPTFDNYNVTWTGGFYVIGGNTGLVLVSLDAITWTELEHLTGEFDDAEHIYMMDFIPSLKRIVMGGSEGILATHDTGYGLDLVVDLPDIQTGTITEIFRASANGRVNILGDLMVGQQINTYWADDDWHVVGDSGEPSLQNSWVDFEGGYDTASFRKDAMGFVHLTGLVKGGTFTDATLIFTLPVGYRPANPLIFVVAGTGPNVNARIVVTASGEVKCYDLTSSIYISFFGAYFYVGF